jgi:hypothetical protein
LNLDHPDLCFPSSQDYRGPLAPGKSSQIGIHSVLSELGGGAEIQNGGEGKERGTS